MNQPPLELGAKANDTAAIMQDRLEATRYLYEQACARVSGQDEEWEKKKQFLITKIAAMAKRYDGQSGAQAAYILGQILTLCEELEAPRQIKIQWEDAKKRYGQMLAVEEGRPRQHNITTY
jgi:hypothetical protein